MKYCAHHHIKCTYQQHDLPLLVADRYIYCKVILFLLFHIVYIIKKVTIQVLHFRSEEVCSTSLKCLMFLFAKADRQPYPCSVTNEVPSATMLSLSSPSQSEFTFFQYLGAPGVHKPSHHPLTSCTIALCLSCSPLVLPTSKTIIRAKSGSYACLVS